MSDINKDPSRRPGPIGFIGDSKITSVKLPDPTNEGGMGNAEPIRLEGSQNSRELKIHGPMFWLATGLVGILVGVLLLEPVLAVAGAVVVVGAGIVSYRTKSEIRVRSGHRNGG